MTSEQSFGKMVQRLFEMLDQIKDLPEELAPEGASVTFVLKETGQYYSLELKPIDKPEGVLQ